MHVLRTSPHGAPGQDTRVPAYLLALNILSLTPLGTLSHVATDAERQTVLFGSNFIIAATVNEN